MAADQITEGQYFSYPGHKFKYAAPEYVDHDEHGNAFVPNSIAWLNCQVIDRLERFDHDLVFAKVTSVPEGRLGEPPLLYSTRDGWPITGDSARERGRSARDELLARVDQLESD